jgi:hypothetical protein
MANLQKTLTFVGIVGAVVLVGIVLGFIGSNKNALNGTAPTVDSQSTAGRTETDNTDGTAKARGNERPRLPALAMMTNKVASQAASTAQASNFITNWEDKVDEILTAEGQDDAEKAKRMLEMFPRLPPDGQAEVAQHLSNLVPDENYAALAKFLTNAQLPEEVLDVLMADVLNRPNSLKLPALLEVARDSQNPKAREAKDLLELFLEEDYGADWTKWQTKMDEWLKANPD